MHVSRGDEAASMPATGVRARTRKLLLGTAMQLMQSGRVPSVTDVAEAAEVSRATAYRYFPTQAALVQAAVGEALGPILGWRSDSEDAEQRVEDLLAFAYPRIDEYEATLGFYRDTLKLPVEALSEGSHVVTFGGCRVWLDRENRASQAELWLEIETASMAEAAGLLAISLGLSRMYADDLEQLEAGMLVYDALYRWCRDATAETHNWPTNKTKSA